MYLYRSKNGKDWQKAPIFCMTHVQQAGWDYKYFANEAAAARGTSFN